MRISTGRRASIAIALLALGVGACGESMGVSTDTSLRVLLTDAPVDFVAAAMVDIGAVELVPAGEGSPIVLSDDGTDEPVDLLELQNAATTVLADADIEAGEYVQLRLLVESASVVLADGYEFRDGTTEQSLKVPSGAQTGIKLNLRSGDEDAEDEAALTITPGETVLVVDFDVSRSFVARGNPHTPAGLHGMSFKPTLRVVVSDVAGSISGTVGTALADTGVGDLTVTATPVEGGELGEHQTEAVTTLTAADGSYALHFVVPGTYDVTVEAPDGLATDPATVEVTVGEGEDIVDVDFTLVSG